MFNSEADFANTARPLAEGLIKYAMTAGKPFGITDVEIVVSAKEKETDSVEKGEVTEVVSGTSCGVWVTLHAGDRVLWFSKNNLDETLLQAAILNNMQVIHLVPENADKRLLEKEKVFKGAKADLDLYDQEQPDQDALIAYAKEVEEAAMAQKGVKTVRSVSVLKSNSHVLRLATNGIDSLTSDTSYQAVAEAIAEDASGMQVDYDYSVAKHFSDMAKPQEIGKNAGQGAVAKLGSTLPDTREMPIVLSHDAAETFFSSVYAAINGSEIYKGTTFLKGKLGQQVMSAEVTLVDDPAIPRGLSSGQIDGAGMEMKKITFIEKGILKSYNADLQESRQLGIEPIGRDGGMTNSSVLPGTKTPDELIADIQDGIYIKGFDGGDADVNNGSHSKQAHGLLIKNGKITDTAVDGFVVSGKLQEMFMNVVLANDTPSQPNTKYSLAAPTTRINKVTIAGK